MLGVGISRRALTRIIHQLHWICPNSFNRKPEERRRARRRANSVGCPSQTDENGKAAVENKVHPRELHATILHLMGMDHEKLTYYYVGRECKLTGVGGARVVDGIFRQIDGLPVKGR